MISRIETRRCLLPFWVLPREQAKVKAHLSLYQICPDAPIAVKMSPAFNRSRSISTCFPSVRVGGNVGTGSWHGNSSGEGRDGRVHGQQLTNVIDFSLSATKRGEARFRKVNYRGGTVLVSATFSSLFGVEGILCESKGKWERAITLAGTFGVKVQNSLLKVIRREVLEYLFSW